MTKSLTTAFNRPKNNEPVKPQEATQEPVVDKVEEVAQQVEAPVTEANEEAKTLADVKESLLGLYNEKVKKPTMEETHKRVTFLLEKKLDDRLNKLTKNKRGMKTMVLNEAIRSILDELEKK